MPTPAPRQQLSILEAMILIAGVALGLWMFAPELVGVYVLYLIYTELH